MEDKFKLFILKSSKEEQQPFHHQHKILEDKLPNGKFGILIYKISKKKEKKMRKDIKLFLKKNLYNLEDIRHHFYDV
jgi:hypothetical protein